MLCSRAAFPLLATMAFNHVRRRKAAGDSSGRPLLMQRGQVSRQMALPARRAGRLGWTLREGLINVRPPLPTPESAAASSADLALAVRAGWRGWTQHFTCLRLARFARIGCLAGTRRYFSGCLNVRSI